MFFRGEQNLRTSSCLVSFIVLVIGERDEFPVA